MGGIQDSAAGSVRRMFTGEAVGARDGSLFVSVRPRILVCVYLLVFLSASSIILIIVLFMRSREFVLFHAIACLLACVSAGTFYFSEKLNWLGVISFAERDRPTA